MATYSLTSVEAGAFDRVVAGPSAAQLACVAEHLTRADPGGAAPWAGAPADWARRHLAEPDWYKGLAEDQMQGWENGVRAVLDRPEFGLAAHGHYCAVSDMFVELAARAYRRRGADAVVRRFWPYRYTDEYGLDGRGYFPTHALLTTDQVGRLLEEVSGYDALLAELAADKPAFVDRWREQIGEDLREALPALREMHGRGRMWYAQLDY